MTPRCANCQTLFEPAFDSKTGKVSAYLWKSACGCYGKTVVVAFG